MNEIGKRGKERAARGKESKNGEQAVWGKMGENDGD